MWRMIFKLCAEPLTKNAILFLVSPAQFGFETRKPRFQMFDLVTLTLIRGLELANLNVLLQDLAALLLIL